MSKNVIAIISVLKPIDDTRNFEKIAASLGNTNKYDINIIGFSSKIHPQKRNIKFFPVFSFKRTAWQRLFAGIKTFKILLKLKPEIVIVTCSELLAVTVLCKILFASKIVYDVQENYLLNILHSNTYPPVLRNIIAHFVRATEKHCAPFVDRFFLAEKVYSNQLPFIGKRYDIIENKAVMPNEMILNHTEPKSDKIKFVYSGTIAEHYGVFDAVNFVEHLYRSGLNLEFLIIGYASQISVLNKLRNLITNKNYIQISGGDQLVPHDQILIKIASADYCLLPYQENKCTEGRVPTKLFESIALKTPVIISPNTAWNYIIDEYKAGILFDFKSSPSPGIFSSTRSFYNIKSSKEATWSSCEDTLLDAVKILI